MNELGFGGARKEKDSLVTEGMTDALLFAEDAPRLLWAGDAVGPGYAKAGAAGGVWGRVSMFELGVFSGTGIRIGSGMDRGGSFSSNRVPPEGVGRVGWS